MSKQHIIKDGNNLHLLKEGSPSVMTILDAGIPQPVAETGTNIPVLPVQGSSAPSNAANNADEKLGEYVRWGDNDNWPELYLAFMDKLGVLRRGIDVNVEMHYGNGPVWFKNEYTDNGKIVRKVQSMPRWDEFADRCGFNVKLIEAITYLETFYLAFPELIPDANGKIVNVNVLDTPRCRFQRRNSNGSIPKIIYNVFTDIPAADRVPLDVYNPAAGFPKKKFVYPLMYRCPGSVYYPEPNVYAPLRAGWGDVAIAVPNFVKNVYSNQMALKYHVTVPISAVRARYKDWDELSPADQQKKLVDLKSEIDGHLTNSSNAGKSLISVFEDGAETVSIEPIKNFLDSTRELPNNVAANSELLFALGVDPALVGMNMPGGNDLNGSGGSDKREGRKAKQGGLKAEREISLQLMKLIATINGYIKPGDGIYPAYLDSDTSQTMDENPTGSQTILK